MSLPTRIAAVLPTEGVDREILLGLNAVAADRGWPLEVVHPPPEMARAGVVTQLRAIDPAVVVVGPRTGPLPRDLLRGRVVVAANLDLSRRGVPSVVVDEPTAGTAAARYLLARGLRRFAVFGIVTEPFAVRRAGAFRDTVEAVAGAAGFVGWGERSALTLAPHAAAFADHRDRWVAALPSSVGVYACCDAWGRLLSAACHRVGRVVPDDVAIVGTDNDPLVCGLSHPPMSSVHVPWRRVGADAMRVAERALRGERVPPRTLVPAGEVVTRRSTDVLAIEDPAVAAAVGAIRAGYARAISVPELLRAIPVSRRELERRFRATVGRPIMREVRRLRVEHARRLLSMTDLRLPEVADRCGFANRTKLSTAFARETGQAPARYRRSFRAWRDADAA